MEQARFFLAIALSFLVFLLWEMFFVEKPPTPTEKPAPISTSEPGKDTQPEIGPSTAKKTETESSQSTAPLSASESESKTSAVPQREYFVSTPFYEVTISNRGAVFQSVKLADYREKKDKESPKKEMVSFGVPTLETRFSDHKQPDFSAEIFQTDAPGEIYVEKGSPGQIVFTAESAGIRMEKRFHFSPETYLIEMEIIIENKSGLDFADTIDLSLKGKLPSEKGGMQNQYGFSGPSALIGKNLLKIDRDDIEDLKSEETTGIVKWIGLEKQYFISAVLPKSGPGEIRPKVHTLDGFEENIYRQSLRIASDSKQALGFQLYFGPKSMKVLSRYDNELNKAVNFGMFDIIAKPCLAAMNFIHDSTIPNYGIAIIILTIFIKLLLWPLGNKSYKSMNDMKKIQPLMTEVREKYKGDKKKMNEEMMNLYRTYKINPMGGCLPMILQIPVFFAFYRMLYEAIELRHAPFFGWIDDLSAPDRLILFDVSFNVPLMEPPVGIPVLTIIMGATMFLQQKMSPPPGDPTQAKIMMFMPIIFTFIFINFSSGLVLYWLVNNILSISQQYYIAKKFAK